MELFSEIVTLDKLFNATAFLFYCAQRNWTFSFVGFEILRDFWKEQEEGNYWCTRFATSQRQAWQRSTRRKGNVNFNGI